MKAEIYVYKIQNAAGQERVVHRNLPLEVNFLPFSRIRQCNDTSQSHVGTEAEQEDSDKMILLKYNLGCLLKLRIHRYSQVGRNLQFYHLKEPCLIGLIQKMSLCLVLTVLNPLAPRTGLTQTQHTCHIFTVQLTPIHTGMNVTRIDLYVFLLFHLFKMSPSPEWF